MTSVYAILMLLGTAGIIVQAAVEPVYWYSTGLAMFMCVLVALFWWDLKERRYEETHIPKEYNS